MAIYVDAGSKQIHYKYHPDFAVFGWVAATLFMGAAFFMCSQRKSN